MRVRRSRGLALVEETAAPDALPRMISPAFFDAVMAMVRIPSSCSGVRGEEEVVGLGLGSGGDGVSEFGVGEARRWTGGLLVGVLRWCVLMSDGLRDQRFGWNVGR